MAVITVVVLLERLLNWLAPRSRAVQRLTEPRAVCLVADGRIDEQGMRIAELSRNELYAELRQAGVENLAVVKRA